MKRYGNVNGFVYCAIQKEAPKPEPEIEEPEHPEPEPENVPTKKCSCCERLLPLDCFYHSKSNKDRLSRYCMACACKNDRYRKERAKRMEAGR